MNRAYLSAWSILATYAVVAAAFLVPGVTAVPSVLKPGDFALYTIGKCDPGGSWFYAPFFGFEDAEISSDQVKMWARACPVTLRWEVLAVEGGEAKIQISMAGWRGERYPVLYLRVGNESWTPRGDDPVRQKIVAMLNANHTIRVDLDTMDASAGDGTYLGRWGFHMTSAEVAVGRADLLRNWYRAFSYEAPVTVTSDLDGNNEDSLQIAYGIGTFIKFRGPQGVPAPPDLDRYLSTTLGGWQTMPVPVRVHDATSSLMLVSQSWHYDDVLFHLYGLMWFSDFGPYPGGLGVSVSAMHLIDTNIINLPQPAGEDDGAGGQDDGGGSADDPGGGTGDEATGDPGDSEGGDGLGDSEPEPPGFPWPTMVLFAAVALVTGFLAYQRLRPVGGRKGESRGGGRSDRPPSRGRR